MSDQRPNVLLVMTDEHTPQVAGFAGDEVVRTQNLDRLAAGACRFNTASCTVPVCTSSRMSMLTGKDAHNCSAWNNHWVVFPEHRTWPQHFAEHGYTTCLVGKMHFGGKDQMQGFQHRPYGDLRHGLGHQPEPLHMFPGYNGAESAGVSEIPESLMQDVVVTRETLSFLAEHRDAHPDQPWFVCASYARPHAPFTAPGRYIRHYRDRVPPPDPPRADAEELEPFARYTFERMKCAELSEEQIQRGREGYYACVDFVDDCIGELLDRLKSTGALENTIVIYVSDHGEMAGLHGMWAKTLYYEPSIGIPLLIRGPGVRAGEHEIADPISISDLFPTVCGLTELPVPEGLDGVDWSAKLGDPEGADAPRDFAPSAYYAYGDRIKHRNAVEDGEPGRAWRAVRTRRWKYVEVQGAGPILFDMKEDPEETVNLADRPEHAGVCRELREKAYRGFGWDTVLERLQADRERLPEFLSGLKPSMPNQYMLPDGRTFDAEGDLYDARWLYVPEGLTGGIIPQRFG